MKRVSLIWALMIFVAVSASAGNNWTKGVLILTNDKVLTGATQYHEMHQLIQIKEGNKIRTFNAWQVKRFTIYDRDLECPRNFISTNEAFSKQAQSGFYEIVIKGEVSLLRKKQTAVKPKVDHEDDYKINGKSISPHLISNALQYEYYFAFAGKLYDERRFSSQLFGNLITHFDNKLLEYCEDQQLRLHDLVDQITLIKYYNQLHKTGKGRKSLTSS